MGSDKERKKDSQQGKKTPGKDLTKSQTSVATKFDKKCVNFRKNIQVGQKITIFNKKRWYELTTAIN